MPSATATALTIVPPPLPDQCTSPGNAAEEKCFRGDAAACYGLVEAKARVSLLCAERFLDAACNGGHGGACFLLACPNYVLSVFDSDSSPIERAFPRCYPSHSGRAGELKRAYPLLEKECSAASQDSCVLLGRMFAEELGVPKDIARGIGLFKTACKKGGHEACARVGRLIEDESLKQHGKAEDYYRKACDHGKGMMAACLALPQGLDGLSDKADGVQLFEVYSQACRAGDATACRRLQIDNRMVIPK
jgi:TPR repeat protein